MNEDVIYRSLSKQTTEEEERRLALWRRESEENDRRFHELAALLRLVRERSGSPLENDPPSGGQLIELAEARAPDRARGPRESPRWLAAAGRGIAVATVAGIAFTLGAQLYQPPPELKLMEAQTGTAETVILELDDGSAVRLGPDSRLQILSERRSREVQLDGRAFFSVARDEDRPFRVRTALGEARVLGTRFEIQVTPDNMRLVVVEGSVALHPVRGEALQLTRDQVALADRGADPRVVTVDDVWGALLDWMADAVIFQDTPLARVALELASRYGVRIEILDDELAERTVTARLTSSSFEETLSVICMVVGARCSVQDGDATIGS